MKTRSRLALFIVGLAVWCLFNWPVDASHLILGIFVSLVVTLIFGDLFVQRPHTLLHATRYLWFLYYIPVFLWECLKANIDVAYRVLHPKIPINPGIIKVKTTLKSDTGLTFLANTITLTPGTMTVDIDPENGYLFIHCINVETQDVNKATEKIVKPFEKILRRIFE